MMKSSFIFALVFLFHFFTYGQQGIFTVKVDKDTMFTDEVLKVEFIMDNLTGNFKAPSFSGFRVVAGPNTSSSMSIINGEVNQKKSYSYILMPEDTGTLTIESAYLNSEADIIETEIITIVVLDPKDASRSSNRKQQTFRKEFNTDGQSPQKESLKNKRVLKKI